MAIVQIAELVEAGVHFGHRASRWNPKMRPYIYGKRNLIHIIDLRETMRGLLRAHRFLSQTAANGSLVVFCGTKRQARDIIEREANRCGMPYVSERWLGGTLTNHRTIRDRLKRMSELEAMWLPAGENPAKHDMTAYMKSMLSPSGKLEIHLAPPTAPIHTHSKKMVAMLNRELTKIQRNLSGIREMNRMPGALIVVDPKREHIAVKEAKRMGVPTVGLIDTDSDPDTVDLPIPGNDDSIRSIELILSLLANSVLEGKASLPAEGTGREGGGREGGGREGGGREGGRGPRGNREQQPAPVPAAHSEAPAPEGEAPPQVPDPSASGGPLEG